MRKISILGLLFTTFSAICAPKSELWPYWQQSNEENQQTLSHHLWQKVLEHNLITDGQNTLFDYRHISNQDKSHLQQYIKQQTAINPLSYKQAEQFAYWVNLYNALTVELILLNYPLPSITKLGGWFSFGPWDEKITMINGKELTLNDIEHRILRPIWHNPKIHYALNCASLGCPNLLPLAYSAENSQTLLEHAAHDFINSNKGAKLLDNKLQLSSIYDWYRVDFGSEQQLIKHLGQYRAELGKYQGEISYRYNWGLNEKK